MTKMVIIPKIEMLFNIFSEGFKNLPWIYQGKK